MTRVKEVDSLEAFKKELKDAGSNLVVVDFTATWCGPCKQISPVFENLSGLPENKNVVFLKVDVDEAEEICMVFEVRSMPTFIFFRSELQDVSTDCGIQCMPTFIFFKNGEKVFEFSGANKDTLTAKVEELRT